MGNAGPAHQFDVVVIGGGPAGSATACRLARAGRRVVLFERDHFPRFHIGESLLASVTCIVNRGLDRWAQGSAKWGDRDADGTVAVRRLTASPVPPNPAVPARSSTSCPRHAAACGADVREGHRVLGADFEVDGVTITVQDESGREERTHAAAVVDASGRFGLLARKFGLRVTEPRLANIAVFAHYTGVPRAEGRRAGDIRVIARPDLGWFWLIPVSDVLMSVGVVLPRAAYDALPRMPIDALLDHAIAETPAVAALMRAARRAWPVRVEKDFSFGARAYAGDRWLLVGDAGYFLDPVFSTGVAIALESGVEAGRALDRPGRGRPLGARLRDVRSPPARALSRVPAVRPGLLYPRLPRSLLPGPAHARPLPVRGHVTGRVLAALLVDARLAAPVLSARAPAAVAPVRAEAPRRGDGRRWRRHQVVTSGT
jgi:flavin-dependent dehydrogenase